MKAVWRVFGVLLCSLLIVGGSLAQDFAPLRPPSGPATLAEALDALDWDPERRGPLIAVDPLSVIPAYLRPDPFVDEYYGTQLDRIREAAKTAAPPPPRPGARGYASSELAPYFDMILRRFGSVSVLAPTTELIVNPRPGTPDPLADRNPAGFLNLLLDSLTEAQWRKLAGEEGLGLADVTERQRPYFLGSVPDPFEVVWRRGSPDLLNPRPPVGPPLRLSGEARAGVRLKLALMTEVFASSPREMAFPPRIYDDRNRRFGDGSYPEMTNNPVAESSRVRIFGSPLASMRQNSVKPGDLDFVALRQPVSLLPDAPEKPLRLGELVRRIAEAQHFELYVSATFSNFEMPVWVRGESAAAGDVLKALCLALCGTVRRVGPDDQGHYIYLLTHNREGREVERARWREWHFTAESPELEREDRLRKRFPTLGLVPLLRFETGEPVPLTPALVRRVAESDPWTQRNGVEIRLSDLPPEQRAIVLAAARRMAARLPAQEGVTPTPDRVVVSVTTRLSYQVPGVGEDVPYLTYYDLRDFSPVPAPPPVRPTGLHLAVSVASVADAERAVSLAKGHSLAAIWLRVPETDTGLAALRAAVAAGKREGVPVYTVASAFRPDDPPKDLPRDVNLFGETSSQFARRRSHTADGPDWLTPDDPRTVAHRTAWLARLAKTEGLSGLALADTLPPGYSYVNYWLRGPGEPLGYGLEHRLAYLRETARRFETVDPAAPQEPRPGLAADPLDVHAWPSFDLPDQRPPLSGDEDRTGWQAWREKKGSEALGKLHAAIRVAAPSLPLLFAGTLQRSDFTTEEFQRVPCFVEPPPGAPLPALFQRADFEKRQPFASLMRPEKGRAFLEFRVPLTPASRVPTRLAELAREFHTDWDGRVLNLTGRPLDDVSGILNALEETAK